MSLPYFQTSDKDLNLLQTQWGSQLNPLLAQPFSNGLILKTIQLTTGSNVINHLLGRTQQGWMITDQDASASVYRSAPFNSLTLTLTSSANVTVNLFVF